MSKLSGDKLVMLMAALGVIATTPAVAADTQIPKAYDAVTENPETHTQTHMWSDGKGHVRSETTMNGASYVTIMDYGKKESYSIDPKQKTITKVPMPDLGSKDSLDGFKSLGTKTIDGHVCEGKAGTKQGVALETWTAKDIEFAVMSKANGKEVYKLVSFKAAAPEASKFDLPKDYKVVDMTEMMNKLKAAQQKK